MWSTRKFDHLVFYESTSFVPIPLLLLYRYNTIIWALMRSVIFLSKIENTTASHMCFEWFIWTTKILPVEYKSILSLDVNLLGVNIKNWIGARDSIWIMQSPLMLFSLEKQTEMYWFWLGVRNVFEVLILTRHHIHRENNFTRTCTQFSSLFNFHIKLFASVVLVFFL